MTKTNNEARIGKMARRAAKLVIALEREGHEAAARKLEAAAVETADMMRAGRA